MDTQIVAKHSYEIRAFFPIIAISSRVRGKGFGTGVESHFQQYFRYIVAVSFIGGRNQRKPAEYH